MKRLGSYILVVIGLIGAFASLVSLDLEPLRTFLIALFVFLLFIGVLWWINDRIALRNSILILAAAKQLGISKIYRPGVFPPDFESLMETSKSISIFAISSLNLISGHKSQLVAALANNQAWIRVLLATPGSEFVKDVEAIESVTRADQISRQIDEVDALLREYRAEAMQLTPPNQVIGKLELGYFQTHLRSSVILFDNSWGWLTLNLPPKRANDSVSLELIEVQNGLLSDVTSHFDAIWNHLKSKGLVTEL